MGRHGRATALLFLGTAGLLGGCGGPTCQELVLGEGGGGGGGATVAVTLDLPTYPTVALQDVLVDWSELDLDLHCGPLDPVAGVDSLVLTAWSVDADELAANLANGTALQSDLSAYGTCDPGEETSCWLSETGFPVQESYSASTGTFLVALRGGEELRTYALLEPTADEDATVALLLPHCPLAALEVDLGGEGGTGLGACTAGTAELTRDAWIVDWADLRTSATGAPLDPEQDVDLLHVAHYDLGLDDLEADFAARDDLAEESWSLSVTGSTRADLADATTASGRAFSGLSGDGVWLLELRAEEMTFGVPLHVAVLAAE